MSTFVWEYRNYLRILSEAKQLCSQARNCFFLIINSLQQNTNDLLTYLIRILFFLRLYRVIECFYRKLWTDYRKYFELFLCCTCFQLTCSEKEEENFWKMVLLGDADTRIVLLFIYLFIFVGIKLCKLWTLVRSDESLRVLKVIIWIYSSILSLSLLSPFSPLSRLSLSSLPPLSPLSSLDFVLIFYGRG